MLYRYALLLSPVKTLLIKLTISLLAAGDILAIYWCNPTIVSVGLTKLVSLKLVTTVDVEVITFLVPSFTPCLLHWFCI